MSIYETAATQMAIMDAIENGASKADLIHLVTTIEFRVSVSEYVEMFIAEFIKSTGVSCV